MNIGHYAKSIVLVVAAVIAVLASAVSDNTVTAIEYVNIAIAGVTAVAAYFVPNLKEGAAKYAKFFVAAGGAALAALATTVATVTDFGDITSSQWLLVLLAGLGAVGLYIVPNEPAVSRYAGDVDTF